MTANHPTPGRFERLHRQGFSLISLQPKGKKPIEAWEQFQSHRATADEIAAWDADPRGLNVGIVTGRISRNIVVLDIDSPEARKRLEELYGPLPKTPTLRTAKGWHLYLIDPTGQLRNFVGKIDGVDLRANGGYVVGAGSIHPSGHIYDWEPGLSPEDLGFADVPDWLLEIAAPNRRHCTSNCPRVQSSWSGGWRPPRVVAYAMRALEAACFELESALPGARNDRLNGIAFSLGRLIASGALDRAEVEATLVHACFVNELAQEDGEGSVRATIRSGIEAGLDHPRDLRFLTTIRPRWNQRKFKRGRR